MKFRPATLCYFLILLIGILPKSICAQDFVYVNTTNLLLRDRPEKKYNVLAVLQPPCKLKIVRINKGYVNDKAVNDRFSNVLLFLRSPDGRSYSAYGWVEKKYIVQSQALVTATVDSSLNNPFTLVPIPYHDESDKNEAEKLNDTQFPYPKYKGGEKHFEPAGDGKRKYHTGPRGGCYYISKSGRKVYVDPKMCK